MTTATAACCLLLFSLQPALAPSISPEFLLVFLRPPVLFSPLLEAARVKPPHLAANTSLDVCCRSSTNILLQQTSTSSRPLHLKKGDAHDLSYLLFVCTSDETKPVCQVGTPGAECCSKSKFPHEGNSGLISNSRETVKKALVVLLLATCKIVPRSCVPNSTEWLSSTRCECK
jgi:hypothetical protein